MPTVALDESQEKKELKKAIAATEKKIALLLQKIEQTKHAVSIFSDLYEEKISNLNKMIIDLDRVLEKYMSISSHVDAHFSFDEASEVFDQAMADRERELEEEYARAHAKQRLQPENPTISPSDELALKRLYRKLARLFHPDIQGGDATIMMAINKAYARGDIATLTEIERSHVPKYVDTHTLFGLSMRLSYLKQMVDHTNDQLKLLRKSEMYKMQQGFLKKKKPLVDSLDELAQTIQKQIDLKKEHIKTMKDAFEAMTETV